MFQQKWQKILWIEFKMSDGKVQQLLQIDSNAALHIIEISH